MRAIVCDCCGKVILIEEREMWQKVDGVHCVVAKPEFIELDLCDECYNKLMDGVRGMNIRKTE